MRAVPTFMPCLVCVGWIVLWYSYSYMLLVYLITFSVNANKKSKNLDIWHRVFDQTKNLASSPTKKIRNILGLKTTVRSAFIYLRMYIYTSTLDAQVTKWEWIGIHFALGKKHPAVFNKGGELYGLFCGTHLVSLGTFCQRRSCLQIDISMYLVRSSHIL